MHRYTTGEKLSPLECGGQQNGLIALRNMAKRGDGVTQSDHRFSSTALEGNLSNVF